MAESRPKCAGGCGFYGNAATLDYCSQCAKRLGIPDMSGPRGVNHSAAPRNECRARGCKFFGTRPQHGLCSGCYAKIRDDLFLRAIAGVYDNDALDVISFVEGGGSVNRIITEKEVTVLKSLGIASAAKTGQTLVQYAGTSSLDVLSYLLSVASGKEEKMVGPKSLCDLAGIVDSPTSASAAGSFDVENVRLEILSTKEVREDGLVFFWTGLGAAPTPAPPPRAPADGAAASSDDAAAPPAVPGEAEVGASVATAVGRVFTLPRCVELSRARDRVLLRFQEQASMLEDIDRAIMTMPLVPGCTSMSPLHTIADLNCFLHGTFLNMCGVRDGTLASEDPAASLVETRTILRDAVHQSVLGCERLRNIISNGDDKRFITILHDIEQGRASLEGAHAFALSNVLRRPIVVYAHKGLEGHFRVNLTVPFRISGIYLPLLWEPAQCVADAITLVYSQGHFTALVGFGDRDAVSFNTIPLCDEEFVPLPIPYAKEHFNLNVTVDTDSPERLRGHTPEELNLLRRYLRGLATVEVSDGESERIVTTAQQQHEPPTDDSATTGFKLSVWDAFAKLEAEEANPSGATAAASVTTPAAASTGDAAAPATVVEGTVV